MLEQFKFKNSTKLEKSYPSILKITTQKKDNLIILIRLLLGEINVSYEYKKYKYLGKVDYSSLPYQKYDENHIIGKNNLLKVLDDSYEENKSKKVIKKLTDFLLKEKANTSVINQILTEISLSLIFFENENYSSSFIHLYRAVENMSFIFPFILVSHSVSYKGMYDSLNSFFTDNNELKMYSLLQKNIYAGEITLDFDMSFYFDITEEKYEYLSKYIFCTKYFPKINFEKDSNYIKCKFSDMFDFIITLRNKTFHMLEGSNKTYLISDKVDLEEIYKGILPASFNWFTNVFLKIISINFKNFN